MFCVSQSILASILRRRWLRRVWAGLVPASSARLQARLLVVNEERGSL